MSLEQTARFFRRNRKRWVSAIDVAKVTGLFSHSQRISDLRKQGLAIECKTVTQPNGKKCSSYRYLGKKAA